MPEHDQYNPPDAAEATTAGWTATRLEIVHGTDHFLAGRLDRVAALCLELFDEVSPRR